MSVLYVASDSEGAGKTALAVTLARILEERGREATAFKPIAAQGLDAEADPDADAYRDLLGVSADGWPRPAPDTGLSSEFVGEIASALGALCGDVIVEGSSRLSIEETGELVEALDARVLVVGPYLRGEPISWMLPWKERLGGRLLGFVTNGLSTHLGTEAKTILLPAMEAAGLASLGVVPEERGLLGVTVAQLARHLDGRFVVPPDGSDGLIEHFLVGGMGMDPGELYFGLRVDKAVVVRGDRPDVQMPALATPTSCLVLTKGIEPIEYVKYEAQQEEVPIMVVETDTLGTMEALNTLMDGVRFDHPIKLRRYAELVERHVDLETLFDALGVRA